MAKKAIYRIKDTQGQYTPVYFQTGADVVLFQDGETLENKIKTIENNGVLIDDVTTAENKVWSSSKVLEELEKKAGKEHTHEISKINGLNEKLESFVTADEVAGLIPDVDFSGVTGKIDSLQAELDEKSDKNHEHGLHSINDWRTHLYNKTEVDDLLNAFALGLTWKAPIDSVEDLASLGTPELGWSVVVGGKSLYIYGEEGWMNSGVASIPPLVTADNDGLMSRLDKTKLDELNVEEIRDMSSSLTTLNEKVEQVQASTNKVKELTNTHETRLTQLESQPQIYYQVSEPVNAVNGSIWIVGE